MQAYPGMVLGVVMVVGATMALPVQSRADDSKKVDVVYAAAVKNPLNMKGEPAEGIGCTYECEQHTAPNETIHHVDVRGDVLVWTVPDFELIGYVRRHRAIWRAMGHRYTGFVKVYSGPRYPF